MSQVRVLGAAAMKRECRRKADLIEAVAIGAQSDEKSIRRAVTELRNPRPATQADDETLIILTDA
jgi:hypothetical protein